MNFGLQITILISFGILFHAQNFDLSIIALSPFNSPYLPRCVHNIKIATDSFSTFRPELQFYLSDCRTVSTGYKCHPVASVAEGISFALKNHTRTPKRHIFLIFDESTSHQYPFDFIFDCLCGTAAHIRSILNHFHSNHNLGIISAAGTLALKYSSSHLTELKKVHFMNSTSSFPYIETGNYWIQILQEESLKFKDSVLSLSLLNDTDDKNRDNDSKEYPSLKPLSFSTLLIPSWSAHQEKLFAEMSRAVKPVAIYFPQFHPIPENDLFWSPGFTEWTLMNQSRFSDLRKPLPWTLGGLGYYNLCEKTVRERQATIAKKYGIHAFMFYHYWFSGPKAPIEHKVMHKIPELLLADGQPDIPFFLSWANEPWNRRWSGSTVKRSGILLDQKYGKVSDWKEHFQYLVQFFHHPNYVRVNEKPVFVIYKIAHIGESILFAMLELWDELARSAQPPFPGLHIVWTLNNYTNQHEAILNTSPTRFEAALHFWPAIGHYFPEYYFSNDRFASTGDIPFLPKTTHQYWGIATGFDRRIRDNNVSSKQIFVQSPESYELNLQRSFLSLAKKDVHNFNLPNLFFINAWNEWNEQAILEPSALDGFGFLEKTALNLDSYPLHWINHSSVPTRGVDQKCKELNVEAKKK